MFATHVSNFAVQFRRLATRLDLAPAIHAELTAWNGRTLSSLPLRRHLRIYANPERSGYVKIKARHSLDWFAGVRRQED
jgi:hypothetical protein